MSATAMKSTASGSKSKPGGSTNKGSKTSAKSKRASAKTKKLPQRPSAPRSAASDRLKSVGGAASFVALKSRPICKAGAAWM